MEFRYNVLGQLASEGRLERQKKKEENNIVPKLLFLLNMTLSVDWAAKLKFRSVCACTVDFKKKKKNGKRKEKERKAGAC